MSYHILFEGIYFVLSYSTQRWNAYVAGNLLNIFYLNIINEKTGKMKHAYNKDKTRSINLKR